MYRFDPACATSTTRTLLPPYLAAVPADVRDGDGCHAWRGPRTGRAMRHASKLILGLAVTLEGRAGVQDLMLFDDFLATGGPDWAEDIAGHLEPDLAPDVLVKGVVGGRDFVQAVTVVDDPAATASIDRESMRIRYRERGCVWSLVREGDLDPFLASGRLWISEAVRRGAPDAAIGAVMKAVHEDGGRPLLDRQLFGAAIRAGVPIDVAADALGCLLHSGRVRVDLSGGVIATDRPLAMASRLCPDSIARAWKTDVGVRHHTVPEIALV